MVKDYNIQKLYYSISEVSKITEVEDYVLRYWETEFDGLKPQKNRSGNRAYTNQDIQLILVIKELIREKKYTIEGAKQILTEVATLEELKKYESKNPPDKPLEPLKNFQKTSIQSDLLEIRTILEDILKKL
ncbi:MAG: MerR family transcriptional regulator [Ignavibacteriales bacterium]|nr:MAG: MerR family transcriptional regulator [Ignavibacteriales bacterium]